MTANSMVGGIIGQPGSSLVCCTRAFCKLVRSGWIACMVGECPQPRDKNGKRSSLHLAASFVIAAPKCAMSSK
jgi:hypothetical protein